MKKQSRKIKKYHLRNQNDGMFEYIFGKVGDLVLSQIIDINNLNKEDFSFIRGDKYVQNALQKVETAEKELIKTSNEVEDLSNKQKQLEKEAQLAKLRANNLMRSFIRKKKKSIASKEKQQIKEATQEATKKEQELINVTEKLEEVKEEVKNKKVELKEAKEQVNEVVVAVAKGKTKNDEVFNEKSTKEEVINEKATIEEELTEEEKEERRKFEEKKKEFHVEKKAVTGKISSTSENNPWEGEGKKIPLQSLEKFNFLKRMQKVGWIREMLEQKIKDFNVEWNIELLFLPDDVTEVVESFAYPKKEKMISIDKLELQKYFNMIKTGVQRGATENKMKMAGLNPKLLDLNIEEVTEVPEKDAYLSLAPKTEAKNEPPKPKIFHIMKPSPVNFKTIPLTDEEKSELNNIYFIPKRNVKIGDIKSTKVATTEEINLFGLKIQNYLIAYKAVDTIFKGKNPKEQWEEIEKILNFEKTLPENQMTNVFTVVKNFTPQISGKEGEESAIDLSKINQYLSIDKENKIKLELGEFKNYEYLIYKLTSIDNILEKVNWLEFKQKKESNVEIIEGKIKSLFDAIDFFLNSDTFLLILKTVATILIEGNSLDGFSLLILIDLLTKKSNLDTKFTYSNFVIKSLKKKNINLKQFFLEFDAKTKTIPNIKKDITPNFEELIKKLDKIELLLTNEIEKNQVSAVEKFIEDTKELEMLKKTENQKLERKNAILNEIKEIKTFKESVIEKYQQFKKDLNKKQKFLYEFFGEEENTDINEYLKAIKDAVIVLQNTFFNRKV